MTNTISSIAPFPFCSLKVLDVFYFDSSVLNVNHCPNTFKKGVGSPGVALQQKYVVCSKYYGFNGGEKIVNCIIVPIKSYDVPLSYPLRDRYFMAHEWSPGDPIQLNVRRIGYYYQNTDSSNIPDLGGRLRTTSGELCKGAFAETVFFRTDHTLPGGFGILIKSRYTSYHLLPRDNFKMPYRSPRLLNQAVA